MMREYRPEWVIDEIRSKAGFLHPGCRFPAAPASYPFSDASPPLIIWNHRWEFDKNPGEFFDALDAVIKRGVDFRLALPGENFQIIPKEFMAARERFKHRIVQYGYVESKEEYLEWLKRGSIVLSTAEQENFGISVVEAVRHGCMPLLPERLVYPEIIPGDFHDDVLYKDRHDLVEKLCFVISNYSRLREKIEALSQAMGRFAWENMIQGYDDELEKLGALRSHEMKSY